MFLSLWNLAWPLPQAHHTCLLSSAELSFPEPFSLNEMTGSGQLFYHQWSTLYKDLYFYLYHQWLSSFAVLTAITYWHNMVILQAVITKYILAKVHKGKMITATRPFRSNIAINKVQTILLGRQLKELYQSSNNI